MLYQIYAMTIKELKTLFRDKAVLAVLFFLPVVFVLVMTFAGVGNQGVRPAKIVIVNQDQGAIAKRIVEQLKKDKNIEVQDKINGVPPTEESAKRLLMKNGSGIALVTIFPSQFSEKLLALKKDKNKNIVIKFIADPATGGQNLFPIERLIQIHIMNVAGAFAAVREGELVLQSITTQESTQTKDRMINVYQQFSQTMKNIDEKIQNRITFQRVMPDGWIKIHPITAEEQNVPGYTIFGVFFIVQVIGTTFLREKEHGTFSRLMAAPISRWVILIGKLIPFFIVNMIQVVFMFAFGHFVFHISLGNSPLGLLAVATATAATANALGLFIAAISKTTEQMGPLSGVILVCMATLGGIFIPYFEMPTIMQRFSFLTPHAWALKGFQDILVRGYDFSAVLPTVGALMIFAFIFCVLALFRFRFQ